MRLLMLGIVAQLSFSWVAPASGQSTALRVGTLYPSARGAAIEDAVVLLDGGKVTAVGRFGVVSLPADANILDFAEATLVPAFWNCHVHFSEPDKWSAADRADAATLSRYLADMLLSRGFVHVVDTGSNLRTTEALR